MMGKRNRAKRAVSKEQYYEYMGSKAWRKVRKKFWRSGVPKMCWACLNSQKPLELHHRSYFNLGRERLMIDVVPMCRDCHQHVHDFHRENGELTLMNATGTVKRMIQKQIRQQLSLSAKQWKEFRKEAVWRAEERQRALIAARH